jgi:hypothetical protein
MTSMSISMKIVTAETGLAYKLLVHQPLVQYLFAEWISKSSVFFKLFEVIFSERFSILSYHFSICTWIDLF